VSLALLATRSPTATASRNALQGLLKLTKSASKVYAALIVCRAVKARPSALAAHQVQAFQLVTTRKANASSSNQGLRSTVQLGTIQKTASARAASTSAQSASTPRPTVCPAEVSTISPYSTSKTTPASKLAQLESHSRSVLNASLVTHHAKLAMALPRLPV